MKHTTTILPSRATNIATTITKIVTKYINNTNMARQTGNTRSSSSSIEGFLIVHIWERMEWQVVP